MEKKSSNLNLEEHFASHGRSISIEKGELLFCQGSLDNSFYYIKSGTVELLFDGVSRRLLKAGDFFGEIRILGNLPRTATAGCLTNCQLIQLSSEQLTNLISLNAEVGRAILAKYGARLLHYRTRRDRTLVRLAQVDYEDFLKSFNSVKVREGQVLFEKGSRADHIYFVLQGTLRILNGDKVVQYRGPGEFVGEIGSILNIPRMASIVASEETTLLKCTASEFKTLLRHHGSFEDYFRSLTAKRLQKTG